MGARSAVKASYAGLRRKKREGRLDPVIAAVLDLEDPGWADIVWDRQWEARLTAYRNFVASHGRTPTLARDVDDEERSIATWVANVRAAWRRGNLDDHRRKQIEAIDGHRWNPKAEAWWERYAELSAFHTEHGRFPSISGDPDYAELAHWTTNTRAAGKRGQLAPDRREALEQLDGWWWELDLERRWWQRCAEYREYMEGPRERILRSTDPALNAWLVRQRLLRRRGKLLPDREEALAHIPGHAWDA